MEDVLFSVRAYCKIILHAAKYPHCAINGLLLARQKNKNDSKSTEIYIEDSIPLFHLCLHVSPMAEIALTLVDQLATQKGLVIAGYYLANENLNDLSTERPAHRIADKVAENYGGALLVVVDNHDAPFGMGANPMKVFQNSDGKWKPKCKPNIIYGGGVALTSVVYYLLETEEYRKLVDFDNHLDNIALGWQNRELNEIIDEAVKRYH